MKTRIIAAAGIILAAVAAVGDDVTIKSVPYKGVTVTDVRDGEIHFRMSRRSPIIRKPLSEVTAITLAGVERFNKARRLLKDGKAAEAVKAFDRLAGQYPTGWKGRLVRYCRLEALGRSARAGRWVQEWLRIVEESSGNALLLALRPSKLGVRGAKGNARAISLLEAKLKLVRDRDRRAAMKVLLLVLYQREGRKEAAALAEELAGTSQPATVKKGNGETPSPPPPQGLERQLKGASVLLASDPGKALAAIEKNLDRYTPAELVTALLLSGKAQTALAAKRSGKQRQELLLKAGLNFMRVWSYYPGGSEAPEALYLAGTVNASLSPANLGAARAAYSRVVSLHPRSPFAAKARAAIGKLKG